ncbi:hypothetical protein BDV93DRAFT_544522 [Ceratobasidium sp. AG-I]|nr:hypothetical protein BDV93DRAFT_544522 [Ceratobasidium sp. AG-I]
MAGAESTWEWSQIRGLALVRNQILVHLWYSLPSGGISTLRPQIIIGFGLQSSLLPLRFMAIGLKQIPEFLVGHHRLGLRSSRHKAQTRVACASFPQYTPIADTSTLYVLGREPELRNRLLECNYAFSFYTGVQPILYSWITQNKAGHTKTTCTTSLSHWRLYQPKDCVEVNQSRNRACCAVCWECEIWRPQRCRDDLTCRADCWIIT